MLVLDTKIFLKKEKLNEDMFDDEVEFWSGVEEIEMLTQKRLELIRAIARYEPESIRELANILHRDIKNVFEDLMLLMKLDLVDFICEGRRKKPIVKKKVIVIRLV